MIPLQLVLTSKGNGYPVVVFFHQDFLNSAESSRTCHQNGHQTPFSDRPSSKTTSAMVLSQTGLESEVMAPHPSVGWKQVSSLCHGRTTGCGGTEIWRIHPETVCQPLNTGVPLIWLQAGTGHQTGQSDVQPVHWQCAATGCHPSFCQSRTRLKARIHGRQRHTSSFSCSTSLP